MHEFSLATEICRIALAEAQAHGATRIHGVRLRVGALRQVVPELMRTAFEACAAGSLLAGADLAMELEAVRVDCASCGAVCEVDQVVHICPRCASPDLHLTGGSALLITAIDIEQENGDGDSRAASGAGAQRCHG